MHGIHTKAHFSQLCRLVYAQVPRERSSSCLRQACPPYLRLESDYRWWFQLRRGTNVVPSWIHSQFNDLSSYWVPSLCLCYPMSSPPLCLGCVWTPFWLVIINTRSCRWLTLFAVEPCLDSPHLRQGSHPQC